jgi:hypothetical protein
MDGIIDWSKDLLLSRGALVETEDAASLRAMLSPEVAGAIGSGEWLSLRFGAGAGSDDEGEWLERLFRLLPPEGRVTGTRLRHAQRLTSIDAARTLDRELVIQNGIYRQPEEYGETARYYFFNFQYTIESDETSMGVWTTCLNATARSVVGQPEALLAAVRENIEDDPAFAIEREELTRLFGVARRRAAPEIRRLAAGVEQHANRRLARDVERVSGYYRDLLRQIERRAAKHPAGSEAAEKERGRAAATELDRSAKLDDLARRYSLRVRIEPGDVLAISLPVREIAVRVIRRKSERAAKFHWNPLSGGLESPWCEACFDRAYPLFLCDDRLHLLCKACVGACPGCGKPFCRACQAKCKCGAG